MRIFLSFASEQEQLAEPVALALRRRGHAVFFSHDDLPPGENFDERIFRAIANSDMLVFLISPEAVTKGRYTLTEVSFARKKWPNPDRHVLPVMLVDTALEKVPNYLKSVTILEPSGNLPAETAAAVDDLAASADWMSRVVDYGKILVVATIVVVAAAFALYQFWPRHEEIPTSPGPPEWQRLNTFLTNVPAGGKEEAHVWSRNGDHWLEQIVNGRTMRHIIKQRIFLNSCSGAQTSKEEDPPLQFFIPDIGCPGMTILFRRDSNPWAAWLPMFKINEASNEVSKPISRAVKVCMGEGGGANCLNGADAKFDCNVYYSWGAGGKMNQNLGANFCSATEGDVKKQLPFDVKVYQNNGGGKCGWTGFLVTCNP